MMGDTDKGLSPSWSWNGLTQDRNPLDLLTQLLHHFLDAASQKKLALISVFLWGKRVLLASEKEESFPQTFFQRATVF